MVATPYVGVIILQYQDGFSEQYPFTASDVNAAFWLGPDGLSPIKASGAHGNGIIKDIILSAAGVDTRTATIRVNGRAVPEIVVLGANIGTQVLRQFQQSPIKYPAGASMLFTQTT